MNTLTDARRWYFAAKRNLERMRRLAGKHWDVLPWDGSLGRDDSFRTLERADLAAEAEASLKPLDDLAVVVMFSVFEGIVRDHMSERIRPKAARLVDPVLKQAAALQGNH